MSEKFNETSLDTIAGALCEMMGIESPEGAAAGNEEMLSYANEVFGGEKADRILMYNPDAIGQWLCEKYPYLIKETEERTDLKIGFAAPMPTVTPVCFATMYTGTQPEAHGIRKYERPTLKADTVFDCLIRAGKKGAIVSHRNCTFANIFKERDMAYFPCAKVEDIHAKVCELIIEDKYDFIAIHAANYDTRMHKCGPESIEALSELKVNTAAYGIFDSLVKKHWKQHNVFIGYAMDHGCHEVEGDAGAHGLDMEEDVNILHFYKAYKREE